jgi:hypothetical protein
LRQFASTKERRPNDKESKIASKIIRATTPDRQQKASANQADTLMQETGYGRKAVNWMKLIVLILASVRSNGTPPSDSKALAYRPAKSLKKEDIMLNAALAFPGGMALSNVTAFQLLIAGGLLLGVAAFLLALSRERRVSMKRSVVTDELTVHTGRIAEALERIANQANERAHLAASRKREQPEPERASEEAHHIAYSMFGR